MEEEKKNLNKKEPEKKEKLTKKDIIGNIIIWIIIVLVAGVIFKACTNANEEEIQQEKITAHKAKVAAEKKKEAAKKAYEALSSEKKVEYNLKKELKKSVGDMSMFKIKKVEVNEDMGTTKSGDYLALLYVDINSTMDPDKVPAKTDTYYKYFLPTVTGHKGIDEVDVFWTAPAAFDKDTILVKSRFEKEFDEWSLTDYMINHNVISVDHTPNFEE